MEVCGGTGVILVFVPALIAFGDFEINCFI
jgi:hypothetical protein